MRGLPLFGIAAIGFALMTLSAAAAPVHDESLCTGPPGALRTFHQNVDDYAALHRQLQERVTTPPHDSDARALMSRRRSLAASLRVVRMGVRQGNIFTPAVAQAFDCRIAGLFNRADGVTGAAPQARWSLRPSVHPTIDETYADHALGDLPEFLLRGLPPVPQEVMYRLFDSDLVLWDIFAQTVVDYIPNALPPLIDGWDER